MLTELMLHSKTIHKFSYKHCISYKYIAPTAFDSELCTVDKKSSLMLSINSGGYNELLYITNGRSERLCLELINSFPTIREIT